jgi:hypothetical protein
MAVCSFFPKTHGAKGRWQEAKLEAFEDFLDFNVQSLMLGKAIVDDLGLIDPNFNPCDMPIPKFDMLMGGLKMPQWLTE